MATVDLPAGRLGVRLCRGRPRRAHPGRPDGRTVSRALAAVLAVALLGSGRRRCAGGTRGDAGSERHRRRLLPAGRQRRVRRAALRCTTSGTTRRDSVGRGHRHRHPSRTCPASTSTCCSPSTRSRRRRGPGSRHERARAPGHPAPAAPRGQHLPGRVATTACRARSAGRASTPGLGTRARWSR